jgi:RNA polymerase sigma-70 factor, ECF subfamily
MPVASPLGDEELSILSRNIDNGDPSALMALYDGTGRLVFGLLLRILGDSTSAEEALLDVYTQIWKRPAPADPDTPILARLVQTAHDVAASRIRLSKHESVKQETARIRNESSPTVSPDRQKLARASMESMAPSQRALLERAYYGCLSCSELAARTGKPIGAVKEHIRLGLGRLREELAPSSGSATEA